MRKANVIPVRNRKMAGGMPPRNCESMNGLLGRRSVRVNESKTWPWIMITAARPRVQSIKASLPALLVVSAIPVTQSGSALLLRSRGQLQFQSPGDGRIDLNIAICHFSVIAGRLEKLLLYGICGVVGNPDEDLGQTLFDLRVLGNKHQL